MKTKTFIHFSSIPLLLFSCIDSVFSQKKDSVATYVDLRIERKVEKTNSKVNVITHDDFNKIPAEKADDFLKYFIGLHSRRNAGIFSQNTDIDIRGFSGRTLVYHNGIPVSLIANGSVNWNRFLVSDIDRIEVFKGAHSSLFGSFAMGGVINIVDKEVTRAFEGELGLNYGSFNKINPSFSFRGKVNKQLSYLISGQYLYSDGYENRKINTVGNLQSEKCRVEEKSVSLSVAYKFKPWLNIKLYGTLFLDNRKEGLLSHTGSNYKKQNTPSYIGTLFGRFQKFKYDFTAYYIWEDFERRYSSVTARQDNVRWADRIDTGLKFNLAYFVNNAITLNGGLDAEERSTLGEDSFFGLGDKLKHRGKYRYVSGYLQSKLNIGSQFEIIPVVRIDNFSFYEADISSATNNDALTAELVEEFEPLMWYSINPKITFRYQFNDSFNLYLTAGKGFRSGTLENYSRTLIKEDLLLVANPNLNEEFVYFAQLSSNITLNGWFKTQVNMFYSKGSNFIAPEFQTVHSSGLRISQYKNNMDVGLNGAELSSNITVSDKFKILASYSYYFSKVNSDALNLKEKKQPYLPEYSTNVGLLYEQGRFGFTLFMLYKSSQYCNVENTISLDSYFTGDTKISFYSSNRKLCFSLSVFDLFDNELIEEIDRITPGRRFEVGVKYLF